MEISKAYFSKLSFFTGLWIYMILTLFIIEVQSQSPTANVTDDNVAPPVVPALLYDDDSTTAEYVLAWILPFLIIIFIVFYLIPYSTKLWSYWERFMDSDS